MKKTTIFILGIIITVVGLFPIFGCNAGKVKVSFVTGTEQVFPAHRYSILQPYGELPTPTREYYEFDGWYSNEEYTKKISEDTTVFNENNHTLYAKWSFVGLANAPHTISETNSHHLAIDNNGDLWAWGNNICNQLGFESTESNFETPVHILQDKKFTQVATGYQMSYAIDTDGNLWGWGGNSDATIGNGTTATHNPPTHIKRGTKFLQVAAGYNITFAIDYDHDVWIWGYFGVEVGYIKTPRKLSLNNKFKQVSIGGASNSDFALLLDTDGKIWACGHNYYGELGNGKIKDRPFTSPTPIIETGAKFIQISASYHISQALDENGNVWIWGQNEHDRLGLNSQDKFCWTPQKLECGDAKFVSTVSLSTVGFAIDIKGNLWIWGTIPRGYLGYQTIATFVLPTIISKDAIFSEDINIKDIAQCFTAQEANGNVWYCKDKTQKPQIIKFVN